MLWEMATGLNDEYSVLVPLGADMECAKIFQITGAPIKWQTPPKVAPYVAPRRKNAKKRADIEYLIWGAIVLNGRAYQALHDALAPFGEFLPLDCMGEVLYFYNVTTLYSVVDYDKSGKTGKCVTKPVFIPEVTPVGFCIFKDVLLASTAIYVNDETKQALENLIAANQLTGLTFGEPGQLLS